MTASRVRKRIGRSYEMPIMVHEVTLRIELALKPDVDRKAPHEELHRGSEISRPKVVLWDEEFYLQHIAN